MSSVKFAWTDDSHVHTCDFINILADGANFVEADRILRNGGYFVWTMDASKRKLTWPGLSTQRTPLKYHTTFAEMQQFSPFIYVTIFMLAMRI